jgi:molybdopterin converting factor small subunit
MAVIHIPTPLRAYTNSAASVQVSGATVGDALNDLLNTHEGLAVHLRDGEGKLRSFVNVYLGDEDIRFLDGEGTGISDSAELTIVPSIAGGASHAS